MSLIYCIRLIYLWPDDGLVIEAETCCHLVTLNKINIHNTSCVLTCELLLLTCIHRTNGDESPTEYKIALPCPRLWAMLRLYLSFPAYKRWGVSFLCCRNFHRTALDRRKSECSWQCVVDYSKRCSHCNLADAGSTNLHKRPPEWRAVGNSWQPECLVRGTSCSSLQAPATS